MALMIKEEKTPGVLCETKQDEIFTHPKSILSRTEYKDQSNPSCSKEDQESLTKLKELEVGKSSESFPKRNDMVAQNKSNPPGIGNNENSISSFYKEHHQSLTKKKKRVGVLCKNCGSVTKQDDVVVHKESCPTNNEINISDSATNKVQNESVSKEMETREVPVFSLVFDQSEVLVHDDLSLSRSKTLECEFCGKAFSSTSSLSRHKHICNKLECKLKCEICGKECLSTGGLKLHLKKCNWRTDVAKQFQRPLNSQTNRNVVLTPIKELSKSKSCDEKEKLNCRVRVQKLDMHDQGKINLESIDIIKDDLNLSGENNNSVDNSGETQSTQPTTCNLAFSYQSSQPDFSHSLYEEASTSKPTPPKKTPFSSSSLPVSKRKTISPISIKPKLTKEKLSKIQPKDRSCARKPVSSTLMKRYSCSCGETFLTEAGYKTHKTELCRLLSQCNWCAFKARGKSAMRKHVVGSHSDCVLDILNLSVSD